MNLFRLSVVIIFITFINGCNVDVVNHDEIKAGNIAADFLELILLKGDFEGSYQFLHPELKKELSSSKFEQVFSQLKKGLEVKSFEAIGFELLDASDNLAIYFKTNSPAAEDRFILVIMYSKSPPNYKVVRITTIDVIPEFNKTMSGTYKSVNIQIKKGA